MTYTMPTNLSSVESMFSYTNDVSGGIFYTLLPITLLFVIFLYLKYKGFDAPDCLTSAGFITTIFSGLLVFWLGIPSITIFVYLVVTIMGVFWARYNNSE